LTLFRASEKSLRGTRDVYAGWKDLAGGCLEVYEIPGGHVSILAEPQVLTLVQRLTVCLQRAQTGISEEELCTR
jgi:thioesterase domain-containing protein